MRGETVLVVVLALLGLCLSQVAAQDLNFNQNAIYVLLKVSTPKCPQANDTAFIALRQQIATKYRVALSEVVMPGCSGSNIKCTIQGAVGVLVMKLFVDDVNGHVEFVNSLITSASLVQPTTQPPKDKNLKNWKVAIGVVTAYTGFLFIIILVIVLMNLNVLRQN